jgi:hypothetical protein
MENRCVRAIGANGQHHAKYRQRVARSEAKAF